MLSRLSTRLFLVVGAVLLASGLGIAQLNEPSVDGLDLRGTTTMLISEQQILGYRMAAAGLLLIVSAAAFAWGRSGRRPAPRKPRKRSSAVRRPVASPARGAAKKPAARRTARR